MELETRKQESEQAMKQAKELSASSMRTFARMLLKLNQRIDSMGAGDIPVTAIPSFITAIASVMTVAIEIEAHALDLDWVSDQLEELMEQLDRPS